MEIDAGAADLHMHTTASDGTCTVEQRITQADERGLEAIAITDHDVIAAELDTRVEHRHGVELITGVEVRADIVDTKIELLGYFIDPTDSRLRETLRRVRGHRRERNRRLISNLQDTTAFDRSYESLAGETDGLLGRPHIAEALLADGLVESIGEAFESFLGADGTAYVPMEREPAAEIIETIRASGGVVSLAHPGRIRTEDVEPIVEKLEREGLDAIEVAYPYDEAPSEGYADFDVADAAACSERFCLLRTGGSDCHGPDSGKFEIGAVRVSSSRLDNLRERAAEREPL